MAKWLGCGPSEVGRRLSASDFREMQAFYLLEPDGFYPYAFLATVISNMSGKSLVKPAEVKRFMDG
jgi:hypothetical protein